MAKIMTSLDFIAKCRNVADNYNTVYGKGMCGSPIDKANIDRMAKYYPDWYRSHSAELSAFIGHDYFGFDCVCFIKTILWGWNGNAKENLGGAVYLSNGVPDVSVSGMRKYCEGLSEDFSSIVPGELLFLSGHIGVYLGDGIACEATLNSSRTRNGVIYSAVANIKGASDKGIYSRRWDSHGRCVFIDYKDDTLVALPELKKGDKVETVRCVQAILNSLGFYGRKGAPLALDASFGADTQFSLLNFQRAKNLAASGVTDRPTWLSLLSV